MTVPYIFTFLHSTHGKITYIDLEDNEKKMSKPHNYESPFGMLTKQVEDAVDHAGSGREPFANEKIVSKACNLLIKLGLYPLGCRE